MKYLKTYESLRDKMTPKELTGDEKIIFDASEDCDSMRLRPTDMFSYEGVHSFNITNYKLKNEDVDIDIDYYTDKAEKFKFRWVITINGAGIKEEVKANTWGEALIGLIDILFPNIEDQIQSSERTLNLYKNSNQPHSDQWAEKTEFELKRLYKAREFKEKYSD